MTFPGNVTLGDAANRKLRFDDSYLKLAAAEPALMIAARRPRHAPLTVIPKGDAPDADAAAFVVLIAARFMDRRVRLEANPQDKLLPGLSQMVAAIDRMAFTPDKRSGEYLLWADTLISLSRLLTGLAVLVADRPRHRHRRRRLPMYRAALSPLLTVVSMILPLAIPAGAVYRLWPLDELSKVMLIVIGITPMLARDLEQRAQEIPAELFIKAQTLGANSWTLVLRVVLPQLLSRLITSPAPAAGLGMAVPHLRRGHLRHRRAGVPRIFPVRRYMAMDVIIPYVIWITLLAWLMDLALRQLQ